MEYMLTPAERLKRLLGGGAEKSKRLGSVVVGNAPTSPTFTTVLPVDDLRWSIYVSGPTVNALLFRPVNYNYGGANQSISISTNNELYVDRDMIGDLICQAWEISGSAGTPSFFIAVSQIY